MDLANGEENVAILTQREALSMISEEFQYNPYNVQGPGCDVDPSLISFEGCECKMSNCALESCTCNLMNYKSLKLRSIVEKGYTANPVYECNSICRCGTSCQNRLVQHGVAAKLEIINTEDRGLGVRTLENITKGQFVCEYAGEVIGTEEAMKRTEKQRKSDMNYIIAVHEYYPSGCGDSNKKLSTVIDPKITGNVGRFINHSCNPNLVMVPVRIDSIIPHLALFAIRDIKINEELSFSYAGLTACQDKIPEVSRKTLENGKERDNLQKVCKCGSANCSGFLPFDKSSFES